MEPILPEPVAQNNYENMPSAPNSAPSNPISNPENAPNVVGNASYEATPAQVQPISSPVQPIAPDPIQPTPDPQSAVDPAATAATPLIADDVDVIEKEWVDKAKKIVSDTKHDPHQQEKAVSQLQADYLLKRYNKTVKLTE